MSDAGESVAEMIGRLINDMHPESEQGKGFKAGMQATNAAWRAAFSGLTREKIEAALRLVARTWEATSDGG